MHTVVGKFSSLLPFSTGITCSCNSILQTAARPPVVFQVFFCKYNDPLYVKMEKLEIMIKLANERNIDQVLYPSPQCSCINGRYASLGTTADAQATTQCPKLGCKAALKGSWQQP